MSPDPFSERAARARPVADAPVEELLERADELARRWIVALVAARALGQMAGVPLELLAREAPALCARLARALRSDTELAELLESPEARGGAGAERSAAPWTWIAADGEAAVVVHDLEALRSVVWAAVRDELRDPPPSQLADLADRLAFVCASLLAAVLAKYASPASAGMGGAASPHAAGRAEQVLYSSPPSGASGRRAVLIDELADASVGSAEVAATRPRAGAAQRQPPAGTRASARHEAPRAQGSGPAQASPRARPWDTPLNLAPGEEQSRRHDPASAAWAEGDPEGAPAVRVTRGPGSPVDERV